jgi:nucleolar complex protein 2
VYADSLIEEAVFLLAEWLASKGVHGSIAYPEVVVSVVIQLRRALKSAKSLPSSKGNMASSRDGGVKGLVERIEESARWVESKREGAMISPGNIQDVEEWESKLKAVIEDSPLGKFVKVLRKIREKQRMLAAKVCLGISGSSH